MWKLIFGVSIFIIIGCIAESGLDGILWGIVISAIMAFVIIRVADWLGLL